ncbi:MAG: TIM barrel protein [Firmicutes bacterium]|nr:TIM barrel protein [Bacillota bacterium]
MNREKIHLSTIDENAHRVAAEYGLGLEIAEFCTPWLLDTEFSQADPVIREKMKCSRRFVLHAPFSEMFPCAIDPKVRQVTAERFRQVIAVAGRYGISKIVAHGGYNPRIYFPIWYTEQSVLFWREFVSQIPEGMVFCLENVFEEEPEMLAEIVRQVHDPRIRMCLDVGHVNAYSHIPAAQWLESCAELIEHFHIHNNHSSRDSHSQLWEGNLPMRQLLSSMEEKCPNATWTLEIPDGAPSVRWLLEEGLCG